MFTGLIEEIGTIESIINIGNARKIKVKCHKIMDDVKIDDSIAIDGVCQTVIEFGNDYFVVEAVEETMLKTNFKLLRPNAKVNLERAAKVGSRIGGHIVQGHTDCVGKIVSIEKQSLGILVSIEFPYQYSKYVVEHGSICINGVSLTIARLKGTLITISVIPHTWENTNLKDKSIGASINLEFDIISKYVENMIKFKETKSSNLDVYIDQPQY